MPKKRYYSSDDFQIGVTRTQLRRLGRRRQLEYLLHWFHRNFENPANETPYNSERGGYQYIWGGPYDAREQLEDEFSGIVSEKCIGEAVAAVERKGVLEWAPGPDHPDHVRAREEWAAEHPPDQDKDDDPAPDMEFVAARLEGAGKPRLGSESERRSRQRVLVRLEVLTQGLPTPQAGIGHNNPPLDDETNELVVATTVRAETSSIRSELLKYEPDALKVANATLRLKAAWSWLAKKADTIAENFAAQIGKRLADAIFVFGGAIGLTVFLADLLRNLSQWLDRVSIPF